jgi:uncharacterized membrane protein
MTDTPNVTPKPPRNRVLRVTLFASLALNLLVVGTVAGFILSGPPHPPPDRIEPGDAVLPYTRALDPEQREDLRRELRREMFRGHKDMAEARDGLVDGYRSAVQVLRADPFRPEELERIMQVQSERSAAVRARGQKAMSDFLASLPPEARAAYADRLEMEVEKVRSRRDRFRDGPRPPKDPDDARRDGN